MRHLVLFIPPCIPDSHPHRTTCTKCLINTVVSPDDVHQVGFIYKCRISVTTVNIIIIIIIKYLNSPKLYVYLFLFYICTSARILHVSLHPSTFVNNQDLSDYTAKLFYFIQFTRLRHKFLYESMLIRSHITSVNKTESYFYCCMHVIIGSQ